MILAHLFRCKQPQSSTCAPLVPDDEAHQARAAASGAILPVPGPLEPWPDPAPAPVPGITADGTAQHCPTCTCSQFDARTSRMLDLILTLHGEVGTAYEALTHAKAILEEEVAP